MYGSDFCRTYHDLGLTTKVLISDLTEEVDYCYVTLNPYCICLYSVQVVCKEHCARTGQGYVYTSSVMLEIKLLFYAPSAPSGRTFFF